MLSEIETLNTYFRRWAAMTFYQNLHRWSTVSSDNSQYYLLRVYVARSLANFVQIIFPIAVVIVILKWST